jgi:hypothetical protein
VERSKFELHENVALKMQKAHSSPNLQAKNITVAK